MKRTEPQSIREVLEQAINECELQEELLRRRAEALWPRVMGQHIAAMTGKPFFRGAVMHIPVEKPSLRNELTMMRSAIAASINKTLGSNVVTEIRFIGGIAAATPAAANEHIHGQKH